MKVANEPLSYRRVGTPVIGSLARIKIAAIVGLIGLAFAGPIRADDSADYAKHISTAQSALAGGRLDDASKELDAAIKLVPSRFEAFLLRGSVDVKEKDFTGAEAALAEAQKLAPQAKRQRIGELLAEVRRNTATGSATQPALSGQDRLALAEMQQIADDAQAAQAAEARDPLLAELLTKSGQFIARHPRDEHVLALRGACALQLERPWEAGEAAATLIDLGALDRDDEAALRTIAKADRNGWVELYREARKQMDELELAAQAGDAGAALRLGDLYYGKRLYELALAWDRKSAAAGNGKAADRIGMAFRDGTGIATDQIEAVAWFRKGAEAGDGESMADLGAMYIEGRGVAKDEAEGAKWLHKGADTGDGVAMRVLGECLQHGVAGMPRDDRMAMDWYRKSATAGCGKAADRIGMAFRDGNGVAADQAEAVTWFRKGAKAGDGESMADLGEMYLLGRGLPKDEAEGLSLVRKGADTGDPAAMTALGALYGSGIGVQKDLVQARFWLLRAAQAGEPHAKKWLADNPRN